MGAAVVRTHPSVHCSQREVSDAHGFLLMRLGKNSRALGRRQHIEQLARCDYVNIEIESLTFNERQRLRDEGIRNACALEYNRALRPAAGRAQTVNALRSRRCWRQAERSTIKHHFGWTRDERRDYGWSFRERGRDKEPHLLRVPRRQRDHGAERKIVLQQLQ